MPDRSSTRIRVAPPDQVACHEGFTRTNLADLIEAHHRASDGFQVGFGNGFFVPTAALEIKINHIAIFSVPAEEVSHGHLIQDRDPMLADFCSHFFERIEIMQVTQ